MGDTNLWRRPRVVDAELLDPEKVLAAWDTLGDVCRIRDLPLVSQAIPVTHGALTLQLPAGAAGA